jgi:thiol peroxidase
MAERKGAVTLRGKSFTLIGNEVAVGDKAPDVELLGNDLSPVKISDFKGKVVVLSAVPSLDTPTCDMETRRFNTEAANLGEEVAILTVSTDLPFAQKRWCGAAGVDKVKTVSDHREAGFGQAYGVLIKELRLLARSIFVLDKKGVVQYVQHVKEISQEPDYAAVIAAVKKLVA